MPSFSDKCDRNKKASKIEMCSEIVEHSILKLRFILYSFLFLLKMLNVSTKHLLFRYSVGSCFEILLKFTLPFIKFGFLLFFFLEIRLSYNPFLILIPSLNLCVFNIKNILLF